MLYIAYLDEFGHAGPYLSHDHPKHNTHPVFGIGGFVLPYYKVRAFSSFFFQLKNHLLSTDLSHAKANAEAAQQPFHPAKWEKKGASVLTEKNVNRYRETRAAVNRIMNRIRDDEGFAFYVGRQKRPGLELDSTRLYLDVMREVIARLDQECSTENNQLMIIIDQHTERKKIVETASIEMFGQHDRRCLIEPPTQVESHLYQTIQCADWLCALYGRLSHHICEPEAKAGLQVFEKYFGERLRQVQRRSRIRTFGGPASPARLQQLADRFPAGK
ncbi:DUF3800 domain-containing protein [Aeromonas dhakensis]|uniref:DUF3800 domain-containing protein n=1 Tax=Aeromonas dhakensis TaxID=196024 RepID=UPI003EE046EA